MFIALRNSLHLAGFDIVCQNRRETVYSVPAPKTPQQLLALRLAVGKVGGRLFA